MFRVQSIDKVNDLYCPEDENGETIRPNVCLVYTETIRIERFLIHFEYNSVDEDDPYTNATSLYDVDHFDKRYNGMYVQIHGTTRGGACLIPSRARLVKPRSYR